MVFEPRAYEGTSSCQFGRRQGEVKNRRRYKQAHSTCWQSRARRKMEGRGAWSRQPYTAFSSTSDQLQNGYTPNIHRTDGSPSKPRPYSQQTRKPGAYHGEESKVDQSYQDEELSPLDALLNGSLESHEDQHGYGLQGLVKKFAHDNNRPSRQMLMLQQQIYQEGQAPLTDLDPHSTPFYSQFTKCQTTSYYGNGNPWQQQHHLQNGYMDIDDHYKMYEEEEANYCGQYNMDHTGHHGRRVNDGDGQYGRNEGRGQLARNEYPGQHSRYLHRNPDSSYSYNRYNSNQNPTVPYPQENYYSNHNNHHGNNHHSNSYHGNNYYSTKVFYPLRPNSVSPTLTMYSTDGTTGSTSPSLPDSETEELVETVEVVVSNLDYNISPREWKHILLSQMKDHVKILWIDVFLQPDNTSLGFMKVATIQEARHAIAMFHRKKLGYKRINLALKNEDAFRAETTLRSEAAALLSEAKGNMLPLFKFIELFNKKYKHPVSVAELYKMRDTIEIREQGGAGRMIHLIPPQRRMVTPPQQSMGMGMEPGFKPEIRPGSEPARASPELVDLELEQIFENSMCMIHCPAGSMHYLEAINTSMLPNVKLQLKTFSAQVHSLLMLHDGHIPLMSFPVCYRSEVMQLPCVYEGGVPLEHLISCVPGVQIVLSNKGVKKVSWAENKAMTGSELLRPCPSTLLNQQLSQLSREMIELLKSSPGCCLTFTHFSPAYHHHFGHQCRIADYGYSRLVDLFEAIPQVVQVLGAGERRMVTLTHKTQLRRFSTDLLRLLKISPGKQLYQSKLKEEFGKMFNAISWDIKDYGVCYIEDMLGEIPAGTILMTSEGQDSVISVPRKDQTSEELERTKQFSLEVVDLLKHNQQCRMMFNKFIPAYHHHFGRQCRVSDYGFTKLLDLFEAIPHIVEVEDEGEEKVIRLTEPELRKVVGEQIVSLLRQKKVQCFPLDILATSFSLHYGYHIPLQDFNVNTMEELMTKLKHVIKVEIFEGLPYIILADRSSAPPLARQVLQLLMDQSGGSLPLMELCSRYKTTFGNDPDIQKIKEELLDYVQISGDDESGVISLTPLQMLARDIRVLLQGHGKVVLGQFERLYFEKFGMEMKPALYGFPSTVSLLMAVPHVVCMKGKGQRRIVHLSGDLQSSLPIIDETSGRPDEDLAVNESSSALTDDESPLGEEKKSPLQRLVNSSSPVSSPNLMPGLFASCRDQLTCNFSPDTDTDVLFALNDEERKKQKSPLCRTPMSQLLHQTGARSADSHDGHVTHSYKADDSQSPDIIDTLLKYGWWKSQESDEYDKSPETAESLFSFQYTESDDSILEQKLSHVHGKQTSPKWNSPHHDDETAEDKTTLMSENSPSNGIYATVAYLRKEQMEQEKEKSPQSSQKPKMVNSDEDKIRAGDKDDEQTASKAPIALCPRSLQPGSYWFSKQCQPSSPEDDLPSTSKQEVRKILASLPGKQVKKPESVRCSETEIDKIENVNMLKENANTTGPFSTSAFSTSTAPTKSNIEENDEEEIGDVNLSDAEKAWLNHEGDDDDCLCYDAVFSPESRLETSSVISDGSVPEDILPTKSSPLLQRWLSSNSSFLSDESQNSLWGRGQRRCRIAAKFEQPLE